MNSFKPAAAASCLKSQGSSTTPHGPGGKVPMAKDSVSGAGMGYNPGKASGAPLHRPAPEYGMKTSKAAC